MGLDVYLYRYEDYEATKALENEADAYSTQLWNEAGKTYGENIPADIQDQLSANTKEWNEEHGLDEWGEVKSVVKQSIKLPSTRWPDHLFKIGYFRSSYNDSGFNPVVKNLIGKDLYWIFQVDRDDYHVRPDWRAALERANQLADELVAQPQIGAFDVSPTNLFDPKPADIDEAAAIKTYLEQAARDQSPFGGSWSNKDGHFFPNKPLRVLALVNGVDCFNRPAIIVVHEKDLSSYVESARIVVETCQYVLDTGEPEKHVLHWSG